MVIQKPKYAVSKYHNSKQTESIVLMAVCDPFYKFIMVDIGQSGSESDGGIWESSTFGQVLLYTWSVSLYFLLDISMFIIIYNYCVHKFYSHIFIFTFIGRINLPEPVVLPGDTSGVPVPYVFVTDETFPLKPYLSDHSQEDN